AMQACARLARISGQLTLFAYSYAALAPFRLARARGWRTVLGQIDPGPGEERIVARLGAEAPALVPDWRPMGTRYWDAGREETRLADLIVVNSPWSRRLLEEEGVPPQKIRIVPLGLQPPTAAAQFRRTYPQRFTAQRPLRVLFLGQVNLRKGVAA